MLKLHKGYSISFSIEVIKKLTQQYIGSFQVVKRGSCLVYKLDILGNWKIYSVFSITQLKPAPSPNEDLYSHLCS